VQVERRRRRAVELAEDPCASRALRSEVLDGLEDRKVLKVVRAFVRVERVVEEGPSQAARQIDPESPVVVNGVAPDRVVDVVAAAAAVQEDAGSETHRVRAVRNDVALTGRRAADDGAGTVQFDSDAVSEGAGAGGVDADEVALNDPGGVVDFGLNPD